jgi:ElaB/YqjD/DUF883 family membrane-anchored ribosome-binding protein
MYEDTATLASKPIEKIDQITQRVAGKADAVIASTQRVANDALDALHGKVETLREQVPDKLHRTAARVDELARLGIERASQAGSDMRQQVSRASDRTVGYIREEPLKSMLIAAAAGAALATVIGMLSRSGSATHHHH